MTVQKVCFFTLFLLSFSLVSCGGTEQGESEATIAYKSQVYVQEKRCNTSAKQAVVYDVTNDLYLCSKNVDERMAPSSMTKMMTAYVVFNRLKSGSLKLDDRFKISKKAWAKKGSKTWLQEGGFVSVSDLLRGMLIQSGNDAAIALAEGLSKTEENFSEEMNQQAIALGMINSHFLNASGWPDEGHYSTARDLLFLSKALIQNFPEYYALFGERSFTYSKIKQENRNPLLGNFLGADGLKTGHTESGGYGLAASAVQEGRRLVTVVNGLSSSKRRASGSASLLKWGFDSFKRYDVFKEAQVIDHAQVWMGNQKEVALVLPGSLSLMLERATLENVVAQARFREPLSAPLKVGEEVGKLILTAPDHKTWEIPLLIGQNIESLSPFRKGLLGLRYSLASFF